ncbi:MAG TPA: ORF6N domain-containing protein [Opitutus sp.]|nr:ORF6N domain-containing protein [Opitutus sp.]
MKEPIGSLILTLRKQRVILSADLAVVYGVEPRALNQAVKRNADRFPGDFCFQLTRDEFEELKAQGIVAGDGRRILRSQSVTLKRGQHAKFPPRAFTEHGAIMAATVLNSPEAVAMSVFVVRAFVQLREQLAANAAILKRLAEIDKSLLEHDEALRIIWQRLQPLLAPPPEPPRRRMGFYQPKDEP